MTISPIHSYELNQRKEEIILRGFGGGAGIRSMMTDRGGTGIAAKFRTTRKEMNRSIKLLGRFFTSLRSNSSWCLWWSFT